ncbi:MAG: hypothetical protein COB12_09795 [Flavobacterium sp.]|nr:MAG: hypothetical protein COB12_09795 [Flavobacterium sp.]
MKNQHLIIFLFLVLSTSCSSQEKEKVSETNNNSDTKNKILKSFEEINKQNELFEVASGKIVFQYSGSWTGTERVWFDNYGKRVVIEQDIYYSKKNHQKVLIIWAGTKEESLTCEYLRYGKEINKCFKPFIRSKDSELSLFAHGDEKQLQYGYNPLGSKNFLGKEAQGWESKSGDITGWVWKGIDVAYYNQGVEKIMLSFEEIDEIPEELFLMPSGFSEE